MKTQYLIYRVLLLATTLFILCTIARGVMVAHYTYAIMARTSE